MEKLDFIARKLIDRKISADKAKNMLIQVIYENPAYFSMQSLNMDTIHSFLLWAQKRFYIIVSKYNPKKGNFSTYCKVSVQMCLRSYLKTVAKDSAKENSIEELAQEEYYYQYNKQNDFISFESNTEETALSSATGIEYFTNIYLRGTGHHRTYQETVENLRKAACLILALKSCCYVDADIIRKVSKVTNLSETEISSLMEKTKIKVSCKIRKRNSCIESRNAAFFYHKRYFFESQRIVNDTCLSRQIKYRYENQTRLWKKRNELLRKKTYKAVPSNTELAQILNVSDRRIAYILKSAQRNIDIISLKDYDIDHETVSCNWQRKQKEGDDADS